jgi:hypothetical protein
VYLEATLSSGIFSAAKKGQAFHSLKTPCLLFFCAARHVPQGGKMKKKKPRGVSHCDFAIYIKKYLNAKEELWKLIYFTMQKYTLQQIL